MGIEKLKNDKLDKFVCPNCNNTGKKLENASGIMKCDTLGCKVKRFFSEDIPETLLKRTVCPNCNRTCEFNERGKMICLNPECRINRVRQ